MLRLDLLLIHAHVVRKALRCDRLLQDEFYPSNKELIVVPLHALIVGMLFAMESVDCRDREPSIQWLLGRGNALAEFELPLVERLRALDSAHAEAIRCLQSRIILE